LHSRPNQSVNNNAILICDTLYTLIVCVHDILFRMGKGFENCYIIIGQGSSESVVLVGGMESITITLTDEPSDKWTLVQLTMNR